MFQMMIPIWGDKKAERLNADFLARYERNMPYVLLGVQMLVHLDPKQSKKAIELVTYLGDDVKGRNLEVKLHFFNLYFSFFLISPELYLCL